MDNPQLYSILLVVLIFAFIIGTFIAVFGVLFFLRRRHQKKVDALMAVGKQGEATIMRLDDTGVLINNNPRVRLLLSVRIPGYSEYQVTKTLTIPMIRLPQIQPGSIVGVMADPMQPQNPDMVGLLLK
jgi:hypothetical protein